MGAIHLEVQGHEGDSGQKDLQQGKQIDETMFADVCKAHTRLQGTRQLVTSCMLHMLMPGSAGDLRA